MPPHRSLARAALTTIALITVAIFPQCGGRLTSSRTWVACAESLSGASCGCFTSGRKDRGVNEPAVSRCESYACCSVGAGPDAWCLCYDGDTCPGDEVGPGATSVASCPPPDEQQPFRCAKEGEDCNGSYLSEHGLEECCDGSTCKLTSDGKRTCQTATPQEIIAVNHCARMVRVDREGFEFFYGRNRPGVLNSLEGKAIQVGLRGTTTGPGGCIVATDVQIGTSCDLTLTPSSDGLDSFLVMGGGFGCSDAGLGGNINGTANFANASCEAADGQGTCYLGTFEFQLASDTRDGVSLNTSGLFCPSTLRTVDACPGDTPSH